MGSTVRGWRRYANRWNCYAPAVVFVGKGWASTRSWRKPGSVSVNVLTAMGAGSWKAQRLRHYCR
jgi:hypothetical protein